MSVGVDRGGNAAYFSECGDHVFRQLRVYTTPVMRLNARSRRRPSAMSKRQCDAAAIAHDYCRSMQTRTLALAGCPLLALGTFGPAVVSV